MLGIGNHLTLSAPRLIPVSRFSLLFLWQHRFHIRMRTGDNVHADQFAFDGLDGLRSGIGRSLDRGDVAHDTRRDQRVADLGHRANQFDVGGLEHGVRPLHESDQSARFNESNCLWHIFS